MRANTNLSVKKNNQKAPTNYSSAPKFHSLPSSVNKFAASKPSYMFPAKLHTVSPKDDQFEKTFKKDDKYEFKKDDKKNEKMNNINQTNLQGKKASEPPSGHSYGTSKQKYGDYAGAEESHQYHDYTAATGTGFGSGTTTASGSGFGSTTGASGSSTTGTGFGSGSSVSGSGFGSTSGVVGSRGDGGAAGSPSSSASSTGFGGNSTGKQTDSNWPRQTEETPSSGEPWAQSGHSTGTQWSPKSTTDINKDVNAKDYKKDFENKKDEKKLNDPLQTTFTSTSFPEVTSKTSMDSSTQKTAEDSLTKGTKAANDNSGIESRYDRQQFNNTYDYLEKKASETLEDVTSASQKAINFINRTGSSASEGMYTGVTGEKSKDEMDKLKDKGFNTQSSEFDKKAGEKDQSFRTYGTKKENEVGIKTPDAEKNNMNTSNTAKADSKEYENKVKGLEHKDQTFYADTLGDKGKTNIKGDPYLKTTDTTSKDYEHKVKGTHYNEIEEPTVETVSKGDYEARNEKESNKSTYDYMADKAKDIYHDVAEKAKDTYNNLGTNTKHAINDVAEKAKDTYNNMGTSTKNAINNAENKVQHVYNAAETQAKNAAADFQEGQRTYNDSQTGEQKATTDSGIGSMASNIVNKVKETAENVKEKVGNILHSVTGENAKESDIESARSASNQFNNKPYASSNTTNDQSINKKFDTKQNSSHRTDHPDNIGHASS